MADILSFASAARQRSGEARRSDPAVLVFGAPATLRDCRILEVRGGQAGLQLDGPAPGGVAVLINLAAGRAHYGRLASVEPGRPRLEIVESHDLEAPGAPQRLRRIWLDRTLTEGADSTRAATPAPLCA